MNKILIIFECDSHRRQESYCIKFITSNKALGNKKYAALKRSYKKNKDWFLNLAEYEPNHDADSGSNIFYELEILKTTEKNEDRSNQ